MVVLNRLRYVEMGGDAVSVVGVGCFIFMFMVCAVDFELCCEWALAFFHFLYLFLAISIYFLWIEITFLQSGRGNFFPREF